ncbi:MAG TPA: AAA domain-containing protein [Candidatus Thermoplasmatota archaeon]|nr:AAA domain-containing protein [Candidatus Thermoplasmatota archaeon]
MAQAAPPTHPTRIDPKQRAKYVAELRAFRDRLLNLDTRNPSLFLRRIAKRRNLDLAALPKAVATEVLTRAARGPGDVLLVADKDDSEAAVALREHLTQLHRAAVAREEETGLREMHLGLVWAEGHLDAETFVRGPLFLFPVSLVVKREGKRQGWYLRFEEAPPQVNKALLAAVRKLRGFRPPETLEETLEARLEALRELEPPPGAEDLHTQLTRLLGEVDFPGRPAPERWDAALPMVPLTKELLEGMPRTPVALLPRAVAGLFPQASSALYQDMEEMMQRAEAGETNQGIVDNLLDAPADPHAENPANVRVVDLDQVPDRELNTVLLADPTQESVVVKAQRADCVVVRGPPGTGKSQVIVNLVADALARNERVLVVCQKRAALDVVYDRLQAAGLGDAAFLIHDVEADRAALYAKIARRLGEQVPPESETGLPEAVSAEVDDLIRQMKRVADPLGAPVHGIPLHALYARAETGFKPRLGIPREVLAGTEADLQAFVTFQGRARSGVLRFDTPHHPLAKRESFAHLGHFDKPRLEEAFEALAREARTPGPRVLLDVPGLAAEVATYERLQGSPLRFLQPAWYRASVAVRAHAHHFGTLPTSEWAAALARGRALQAALDAVAPCMNEAWRREAAALAPEALAERALLCRDALARDFDALQAHDQLLASVPPGHVALLRECAARLDAALDWGEHAVQEVTLHWIEEAETRHPELRGAPFERYDVMRVRLRERLDTKRSLLARALAAKARRRALSPELPPGEHHASRKAATDWNKLQHEVTKKRHIQPLRALLRDHGWALSRVAPVWLASPEVVSEAFPLERGLFDVVIFDEASQLAVERALPVLYRGKRVVIAGDEQQMPPSRFFEASAEDEESLDDEEPAPEPLKVESLLLLAKRVYGFDYLGWHYRSRREELIEFSNHAYYEGRLHVAANLERGGSAPAIEWVPVKGRWEARQNRAEAEKVVDLLHEELRASRDVGFRTVGVITFNERQQQAVLDEIERRRGTDPAFAEVLALAENPKSGKVDDKPFVKNLENVQGDERDVILFSVGYAPDAEGRMRLQFGPLGVEGGENRLNVAITRARLAMRVVCSFDPAGLNVEATKNLGPKRFKQFLQYAKAVSEGNDLVRRKVLAEVNPQGVAAPAEARRKASPLVQRVERVLREAGYTVEARAGLADHGLDLAVADPLDPKRYCLGVELDGAAFGQGVSIREREVARDRFLESRGWKVVRVWGRNWWRDPGAEASRVLSRLPVPGRR